MTRLERQSFLGSDSDAVLGHATIGLIGLGGGGSHEAQQLAHLGVGNYVLVDPDRIEDTNTNRLVGGSLADVACEEFKVVIAARQIRKLVPDARILALADSWHDRLDELKGCDVILGAVDSFTERDQIERFCRRFLIPYIDVGMDVQDLGDELGHLIGGQVIVSAPGSPCMRCCHFLTDERLTKEAERYGAAGSRPQVVWPNGVLASTAVGLMVNMLTPWHAGTPRFTYLAYDGNAGTIEPSIWMRQLANQGCPHYPLTELGDPFFDARTVAMRPENSSAVSVTPRATYSEKSWWQRLAGRLTATFRR